MTSSSGEPCQEELAAASLCLAQSGVEKSGGGTADGGSDINGESCRECWDSIRMFEQEFPDLISGEFLMMKAIMEPNDPAICTEASQNICPFLKANQDCCCIEKQDTFAKCYFDQKLGSTLDPPCGELCGSAESSGSSGIGIEISSWPAFWLLFWLFWYRN